MALTEELIQSILRKPKCKSAADRTRLNLGEIRVNRRKQLRLHFKNLKLTDCKYVRRTQHDDLRELVLCSTSTIECAMDRLIFSSPKGQPISDRMFGIKLERSNGPNNPGQYADTIDALSATSLRFSFNVDSGVEDGRPITVTEALAYSAATRIPAVVCIVADNLFHNDTDSNILTPRSINHSKIQQVKAFVRDLLAETGSHQDTLPNAVIQAIEIGNEYWGLGGMTSLEYGNLANVLASAIQDVMDELGLAVSSQPKLLVQMGSAYSKEFDTSDSASPYFGLTWQQATKTANLDIISQISEESRYAIDGLVEHYYWTSLSNTFRFDTPTLRSIDADWSIWAGRGYSGKELHITEWNNKLNNPSQFGLKGAGVLLEMFENMVRLGVDAANIWPLQHNATRLIDTLETNETGLLRLTPRGAIFKMMAESLPGTRRIDSNLTTENGYRYELNGYASDDQAVFFVASRMSSPQNIKLDLSLAVGHFSFLQAELVSYDPATADGYFVEGSNRIAVPFYQDPDALVHITQLVSTGLADNLQFRLGAYEVVRLVFSDGAIKSALTSVSQVGTSNPDTMRGTHVDDTILSQGGDDLIEGRGGNDHLFGGSGRDTLIGGDGDDTLDGGPGGDVLMGGNGNDLVYVDHAWDSGMGGDGLDELRSARFSLDIGGTAFRFFENARVTGSLNLNLTGNSDANALWGNAGRNVISGGGANDSLFGGAGRDKLFGGEGGDKLVGGSGSDQLWGGAGNDIIYGGSGHDTIVGGAGSDTLYGGSGNDVYFLNHVRDRVLDASGIDVAVSSNVSMDLTSPLLSSLESAKLKGFRDLMLSGNSASNALQGNDGSNRIVGHAGDDVIVGGRGNDTCFGGAGRDTITGDLGADLIYGGGGQDSLSGRNGNDKISGGDGNDRLNGGHGSDLLIGGSGRDVFIFNTSPNSSESDIIDDFHPGSDKIALNNSVFEELSVGRLDASSFRVNLAGQAKDVSDRVIYSSATGRLYYDPDGSGPESRIKFAGLEANLDISHSNFFVL